MNSPSKPTDVRVCSARLYLLPVTMRVPLKFGSESVSSVTCARVAVSVENAKGDSAVGWGETPLSVTWAWPSQQLAYGERFEAMTEFCRRLGQAWVDFPQFGHPLELGHAFLEHTLPELLEQFNQRRDGEPMPHLAGLIAASAFDIAVHDAYGKLNHVDIYQTYTAEYLNRDLSAYLEPADPEISFRDRYPADYLVNAAADSLPVWHLVGGLDPLTEDELTGDEPNDGYPVTLDQWIERDGLDCLKIKLRGTDSTWDYQRLSAVGRMAIEKNVRYLSADFNCTVTDPQYVNDILDRLAAADLETYERLLYVEQPFPYDLQQHQIDVFSVSARKPLFLDESAHDWRFVALGRRLGWSGVALKTCKTQTGAILSLCWAKAHDMPLMVQDLTNPMLAQVPHVRLAAHAGTIMGVESNGMQFYPAASAAEEKVHPGIYRRRNGQLDLSTLTGSGFGYRVDEIDRDLPVAIEFEDAN